MEINEPVATAVFVKSSDMKNRRVRKDFATEGAVEFWLANNVDSGRVDLVEMRWYL